jgi:hypothetical protein
MDDGIYGSINAAATRFLYDEAVQPLPQLTTP